MHTGSGGNKKLIMSIGNNFIGLILPWDPLKDALSLTAPSFPIPHDYIQQNIGKPPEKISSDFIFWTRNPLSISKKEH